MKGYLQFIIALGLAAQVFGQSDDATSGVVTQGRRMPDRMQGQPGGARSTYSDRLQEIIQRANETNPAITGEGLPRFDLDFPGGTPRELVKAIEKATGKPLNAVIRAEDADVKMAAISVKNVNVAQLFSALIQVSMDQKVVRTGTTREFGGGGGGSGIGQYTYHNSWFGFKTEGTPTENSIWYFVRDQIPDVPQPTRRAPPVICRFYQLGPYLDSGYKVEDITTAMETGWRMLGEKEPPKISYHKDTKLLIAVGEETKMVMIEDVLASLNRAGSPNPASTPTPPRAPKENPNR